MCISGKSLEQKLGLCFFPAFQIIKDIADIYTTADNRINVWLILNDRFRNPNYNFTNCTFQDWDQKV